MWLILNSRRQVMCTCRHWINKKTNKPKNQNKTKTNILHQVYLNYICIRLMTYSHWCYFLSFSLIIQTRACVYIICLTQNSIEFQNSFCVNETKRFTFKSSISIISVLICLKQYNFNVLAEKKINFCKKVSKIKKKSFIYQTFFKNLTK